MNVRPPRSLLCPVTVGRSAELVAIRAFLAREGDTAPGVLLLSGDAGAGKSRLTAEARAIAAPLGYRSVLAACLEGDRALPYAPVRDLLRVLVATSGLDEVLRLAQPIPAHLAALFPMALDPSDLLPMASLDPAEERLRLFAAMTRLLCGLATRAPLLLIVEDLHWSDDAGLDFLLHLARRTRRDPSPGGGAVRLLFTARGDEIHPHLDHILAELDRERLVEELTLAPFGPREIDAMLRAIFDLDRSAPAGLLHLVTSLTDGNPFFIEEVLKSLSVEGDLLAPDGALVQRPHDDVRLPRSVQDAVRRRLEALSPYTRQVAIVAAIAGRRFDFELLLALTGNGEPALLAAIKDLIAAQLVVEEGADRFAFRHALTRQAIAAGLLERERRALHRRVAEAIERRHAVTDDAPVPADTPLPVDDLAEHFARAGLWDRALLYARRAGELARALDAPRAAVQHFTTAIEAARQLARSLDPALLRARGHAQETIGAFDGARQDYEAAVDLARAAGDRPAEIEALLALGLLWSGRDYDRAGTPIRTALELARSLGDQTLVARCLNRLGNWHLNREETAEAERCHRWALAAAEAVGDPRLLAETLDLLGVAMVLGGDPTGGAEVDARALALWRDLGDRQGRASTLILLQVCGPNFHTDTLPLPFGAAEAIRYGDDALATARAIGWRSGECWALWTVGGLSLAGAGSYERALGMTRDGLALAEEIGHRQWIVGARCMLGNLSAALFAWDEAENHLRTALALARETNSPYWIGSAAGYLAAAAVAAGRPDVATPVLTNEWSERTLPATLAGRVLWAAAAEHALASGEPALALDRLDRLLAAAPHATGRTVLRIAWRRGEALAALDRSDEAEAALRAAAAEAVALGARPLLWQIRLALGRLLRARGRHDEADATLAAARALVQELAAGVPEPDLRQRFLTGALARFPDPPRRTPRQLAKDDFGGLTEREREIAALLVAGRTNREIAERLYLSEWTVATHVRNILAKLELRSRTQVAAWAVAHGLMSEA